MRVAVLVSGSMTSVYALHLAMKQNYEIEALVSFSSKEDYTDRANTPNIKLFDLYEKTFGIPVHHFLISGEKKFKMHEMAAGLKTVKDIDMLDGFVTGVMENKDLMDGLKEIAKELEFELIAPLWNMNPEKFLDSFVKEGFKAKVTGAFSKEFNKKWIGREIDDKIIKEIKELNKKSGISLVAGKYEFETFVYDGPIFKRKIEFVGPEVVKKENSFMLNVKKGKLIK